MTLLTTYLSALFPVVFCAGLGFALARKTAWLNAPTLPTLVTNIGLPALILNALLSMDTALMALSDTLIGILLVLAISALLGAALLKAGRLPVRGYLPMLVNPNTGNLGIPLVFALLGPQALVHAVLISTVVQISHFTFGVAVLSGRFSLKALVDNVSIIALVIGALWQGLAMPTPDAVQTTLDLLAGMALPVMLLLLGKSLAGIDVRQLQRLGRLMALSAGRIAIGIVSAALVVWLWPMPTVVQHTLLLQATMPVAVLSYLLASHYQGPKDDIAAVILVSTPLSLLAILAIQVVYTSPI
ncbi:MAG: AEC family transporter [Saccharospirillum sp.]